MPEIEGVCCSFWLLSILLDTDLFMPIKNHVKEPSLPLPVVPTMSKMKIFMTLSIVYILTKTVSVDIVVYTR